MDLLVADDRGPVHPRERYVLKGVEAQARAIEEALERKRLHHAWLLIGPAGLGKASFAFRAARRLLGAKTAEDGGPLGSSSHDPVCRLIASQSHPDLIVLERSAERKSIAVEEVRRLPEFFSKASGLGGRRVAILDSVDDLNANGANALLKTLEEPSENGVLFLISHAPGRLLATIRSRCRTLTFRPWSDAELNRHLSEDGFEADAAFLAAARGSPGRAALLSKPQLLDLKTIAEGLLDPDCALSPVEAARAADSFRGPEGMMRFKILSEHLATVAHRRALKAAPASALRWAGLWSRCGELCEQVEGLNLDRADAFWTLAAEAARLRSSC